MAEIAPAIVEIGDEVAAWEWKFVACCRVVDWLGLEAIIADVELRLGVWLFSVQGWLRVAFS